MDIGGSSPFNKKQWVIKEWSMCNRVITVSSFLFVQGQTTHCFNAGNISCNLFPESSSHSDCHNSNIYLLAHDFKSEGEYQISPLTFSCWNEVNPLQTADVNVETTCLQWVWGQDWECRRLLLCGPWEWNIYYFTRSKCWLQPKHTF